MCLKRCFIFLIIVFAIILSSQGNVGAGFNPDDYFPLNQGNEWTYVRTIDGETEPTTTAFVDGTELVDGVQTTKYTMTGLTQDTYYDYYYAKDSEGLKEYKFHNSFDTYNIYDPPRMTFPNDLDVGETFEGLNSYSSFSSEDDSLLSTTEGTHTVHLETLEDISVPAGPFKDCLKFNVLTYQQTGELSAQTDAKIWYAYGVGMVKKVLNIFLRANPESEKINIVDVFELSAYNVQTPSDCPITFALGRNSRQNDLNTLRRFRDKILNKSSEGRELIKLYYQWGPLVINAMEADEEFKQEVKDMVDGVLRVIGEES